MVPVVSSKAQRVLEAGNLTILEKIARRQSTGQKDSARYCDHGLSHCPSHVSALLLWHFMLGKKSVFFTHRAVSTCPKCKVGLCLLP